MTRGRIFLLTVLFLVSIAAVASATTMRALTIVDLTEDSDRVVRGRVLGTSDVMTVVDGRLVPRLVTRIAPIETVVGEHDDDPIVVVEPGGRARDLVFVREGIAEFRRGQEVLVFLARTDEGYRPVGHAQGAFVIGRDRRSGEARLRRTGDPGVLLGSGVDKGLDLGANPRLDATLAVVRAIGEARR